MTVYFLLALAWSGRSKNTVHYSPLRGHSFYHCDTDFTTVKTKKISRHHRIYPDEEQVAPEKKKLLSLQFTKLIARTSLILKNSDPNTTKTYFYSDMFW